MEFSKKQLIGCTVLNFVMLLLTVLCIVVMKFNLLSLILSLFSIGSIFFSSINVWRNAKQLKDSMD